MRRYNQFSSFDEQPMPDLNSEAIDFRAASEYFKRIRKLTLHGLQSLKLTAHAHQRKTRPHRNQPRETNPGDGRPRRIHHSPRRSNRKPPPHRRDPATARSEDRRVGKKG